MRLASVLTLVFLGIASLACGGIGSDMSGISSGLPSVALTEPWTGLDLPVDDGKCFSSSDMAASFQYTSGTKEDHFERFTKHFEADGWETVTSDTSGETLVTVFRKDGAQVAVNALDLLGNVSVNLGYTRL